MGLDDAGQSAASWLRARGRELGSCAHTRLVSTRAILQFPGLGLSGGLSESTKVPESADCHSSPAFAPSCHEMSRNTTVGTLSRPNTKSCYQDSAVERVTLRAATALRKAVRSSS